ncbi:hypothetical protein FACS1894181_19070 [Bacteroidia bacterium]|nr:hypothetical protein FACS1894181_19070 [Bacteroidia bacterium]
MSILMAFSCTPAGFGKAHAPLHLEQAPRYRVQINTPKGGFSGILILRLAENEWRGSLVNEFGFKAFDLASTPRRCELRNVMPFMNKWYIRMTLRDDFAYLLWKGNEGIPVSGKRIDRMPNGAFTLTNTKRHIEYIFQPLPRP